MLLSEKLGVTFQEGLVARVLDEVEGEAGKLPLLEFALKSLWEQQEAALLTHQAYNDIGEVEGALTKHAEEVFEALASEERVRARRVFVQLVHPGAGTENTRRIAYRSEMAVEDWALTYKLADKRLLVTDEVRENTALPGMATAEVVHEALIQRWARLQEWMRLDYDFRSWQERLRAAMRQWEANGRDEGALLRGLPLVEAEDWLAKRQDDLGEMERGFIQASLHLRERERASRERQRRRVLAISIGVTMVMMFLSLFAFNRSQLADQRLTTATYSQGQSLNQAETATHAQGQAQFQAATATALLGQLQVQSTAAERSNLAQQAQFIAAQGNLLFEENPLLGLKLILEGLAILPNEADSSTKNSLKTVFQSWAQEGRIQWLGKNVEGIIPSSDLTFFVVDYAGIPGELRRIDTDEVVPLSGAVSNVIPFPDSPFFVVVYSGPPLNSAGLIPMKSFR